MREERSEEEKNKECCVWSHLKLKKNIRKLNCVE
jgi:hypothetical protein